MYYIIEGKLPHTHNGEPIIIKGEQLYYTEYVITRNFFSNCDKKAKRFKTAEDAQKYIDRWLASTHPTTIFTPKVREDWK